MSALKVCSHACINTNLSTSVYDYLVNCKLLQSSCFQALKTSLIVPIEWKTISKICEWTWLRHYRWLSQPILHWSCCFYYHNNVNNLFHMYQCEMSNVHQTVLSAVNRFIPVNCTFSCACRWQSAGGEASACSAWLIAKWLFQFWKQSIINTKQTQWVTSWIVLLFTLWSKGK